MPNNKYLTIQEACELLRVSRPTFNKIRKQRRLREFVFGKRRRFLREDIVSIGEPTPVTRLAPDKRLDLTVFRPETPAALISAPDTFDLRRIRQFDPHGVLTLFCAAVDHAERGHEVRFELEDDFICNHLRALGFFQELEKKCGDRIVWDKSRLRTDYTDFKYPIPLTNIRLQKEEAPIVSRLIGLLRAQGFSEGIGGYIGWIFGELVDNATTHLVHSGELSVPSDCYLLAQRFKFATGDSECIIIGVADVGPGIHATLKRNQKYSTLSDGRAFLTAFKPNVSSWADEYGRGKGLTDILTIAMGNKSVLRAESGENVWSADFRDGAHQLRSDGHLPKGTRFSLVLIDHEFEIKSNADAEKQINELLAKQ